MTTRNKIIEYVKGDPILAKAADVAPAVHGHWIVNGVRLDGVIGNFRCSVCMGVSLKGSKYCPNCGAKMDMED